MLDQRRRTKWKKVKERNIRNHEQNNILKATGTNSPLLITRSKLVYKTRSKILNDHLVSAVANDSRQLKKGNFSFSQLKRTAIDKVMNSGDAFSYYLNAESKIDTTFITVKL